MLHDVRLRKYFTLNIAASLFLWFPECWWRKWWCNRGLNFILSQFVWNINFKLPFQTTFAILTFDLFFSFCNLLGVFFSYCKHCFYFLSRYKNRETGKKKMFMLLKAKTLRQLLIWPDFLSWRCCCVACSHQAGCRLPALLHQLPPLSKPRQSKYAEDY